MSKRVNPYERLRNECSQWAFDVEYPQRRLMFTFPSAGKANSNYDLRDVYERVQAAETLGWRCEIRVVDNVLRIEYVKKPETKPWALR